MFSRMPRLRGALLAFGLAAMAAPLLFGCGSIPHDAFGEFTDTAIQLRDGTDEVLGIQYQWARDRFLEDASKAMADSIGEAMVQRLLLESVEGSPFEWRAEEPILFLSARKFQKSVYTLNQAIVDYALLLQELAGAGKVSKEEFESNVRELNGNMKEAVAALSGQELDREIAIFSLAASEIFELYLGSKRKNELKRALQENQGTIEEVSSHLRQALAIAARHVHHEYQERSFHLALALAPDSDLQPFERRERLEALIELNEIYDDRLTALRTLDDSYRLLPGANRNLYASLDEVDVSLGSIRRIADNARRLKSLYGELAEPPPASDEGGGDE